MATMDMFWGRSMSWMRIDNRDALADAVALLALGLALVPVLQPLVGPLPTCGYDTMFHLWRAVQVNALWDQGVMYSRWAPDMAQGYGMPLFLFTSAFPPAFVALLHRAGLDWAVAMNTTFGLAWAVGALGMYVLGRTLFGGCKGFAGQIGGLIAAIAYVYAPFQAYDVFNRGSLWEGVAWAFPPYVLLGLHHWLNRRSSLWLALGVCAMGALILSHHLFAFLFGPVLVGWVLAEAIAQRRFSVVARGLAFGVLGLGLTAFFWLPALVERGYVQTDRLLGTWVFDYRYNFLPLSHLVALPRRADPNLLNDWPPKALGAGPLLAGALAFIGWSRYSRRQRIFVVLLFGLTLMLAVSTLEVARPLWDHVPLLVYVQFPWRNLGPAAFCLSLLIGAGASALGSYPPVGAGVVAILMLSGMGWLYPRHCPVDGDLTLSGLIGWERATDTLGATAKGEYLPVWVLRMPAPVLSEDYEHGGRIERVRPEDLPAGVEIEEASYGPLGGDLTLSSPTAFDLLYRAFFYPGWRAWIDGMAVELHPQPDTGLIMLRVPAGEHRIRIRFRETGWRKVADVLSVLSVAALAWTVVSRQDRGGSRAIGHDGVHDAATCVAPWFPLLAVASVLTLKVVWVDPGARLWRATRLRDHQLVGAIQANVNFGGRALLLAVEPFPAAVKSGSSPVLTTYWRALDPGSGDWHQGVAMVGPDGSRWPVELRPVRWARTPPPLQEWPPETYARMDYHVDMLPGTPPGSYHLLLSLFDRTTGVPASAMRDDGVSLGPSLPLPRSAEGEAGCVTVTRPERPPELAQLGVSAQAEPVRCGALALWRADLSQNEAQPGNLLAIRTVWEALTDPIDDVEGTLVLRLSSSEAGDGRVLWRGPLVASWWPTDQWSAGDRWVGHREVRIPGDLESGTFTLTLASDDCLWANWVLSIVAPERRWRLPDEFTPWNTVFGDGLIRLAGIKLDESAVEAGDVLDLTLAWQALQPVDESYRVFVHLLDSAGRISAQNDGEPAGWTRPTPGWAVSEYVLDPRPISVPRSTEPGTYTVRVGLYHPASGRLMISGDGDGVAIGTVDVIRP